MNNKRLCLILGLLLFAPGSGYPAKNTPIKQKVILLGIDGLTERVITRLLAQNKLKNIQYLRDNGSYGQIASIKPTISPALWTTMATGKKREAHGVERFKVVNEEGDYIIVNSSHRKTKAIWNILSEHGMRVGSIGYFTTWPVEKVNGFMISDVSIYPIKKGYYPSKAKDIMKEVLTPYINYDLTRLDEFANLRFEDQLKYFTPKMFKYLDQLGSELIIDYLKLKSRQVYGQEKSAQYGEFFKHNNKLNNMIIKIIWAYFVDHIRFEYAKKMYQKDLDFFALYLKGVDIVSHYTWEYYEPGKDTPTDNTETFKDTIPNYYFFIDRVLEFFLEASDSNTIIILVSDHGFEKEKELSNLLFDSNKILNTMGYLDYGPNQEIKTAKILTNRIDEWRQKNRDAMLYVNLNNIYKDNDHSQDESRIKDIVNQLNTIKVGKIKLFEKIEYTSVKQIDVRSKTMAAAYNLLRETVSHKYNQSGFYIIETFVSKFFYTPRFRKKHPKLKGAITINGKAYPLNQYFKYSANKGRHSTYDGVIHFLGPNIKPNNHIKTFSVLDVTPAILKILNLPIGADMAGVIPTYIFKPEFLVQHPTQYIKSYDEINQPLRKTIPQKSPVDDKIKQQLRSLGYIQ